MTTAPAHTLPYAPLRPLPLPVRGCPCIRKVIATASLVFAGLSMGALFGGTAAILYLGVVTTQGAIYGGATGAAIGLALSIFPRITSPIAAYRLATLKQLEVAGTNRSFHEGIRLAKEFFAVPLKQFSQAFHSHLLYKALMAITDGIDKSRTDAVEVWKTLLNELHNTRVIHPDGTPCVLSMTPVLERLEGKRPTLSLSRLNSWSPYYTSTCQEIEKLQTLSFGSPYTFKADQFKEALASSRDSACFTMWDSGKGTLLGFAWYRIKEEKGETFYQISGIARRPEAARLGIGSTLLKKLIDQIGRGRDIRLHVRKSNPAVALYKSFGFEVFGEMPNHYLAAPKEAAFNLQLNWDKYLKNR